MLYVEPPVYLIEGVTVMRDHRDPLQHYYLPLHPQLRTRTDPVTGVERPQLSLIMVRGPNGPGGGYLDFDVHLGITEETQEAIIQEIAVNGRTVEGERLPGRPRLSPVPVVDGTVKLIVLGAESGAEELVAGAPPPPSRFAMKIQHAAKPSLYGDNQATFSVQLDQDRAIIMEKALRGEMAPVAVVYSLDFLALRPAYAFRISADWNRVQKHLENSFKVGLFFASYEVQKVVDELVESKVIQIESDTFVLESDENAGIISRRDSLLAEIQQMVLETFFEPSLQPIEVPPVVSGTMKDVSQVALLLATGGWAGAVSFTRREIDITRVEKKRLSAEVSERGAVKRTIYPQGHLSGLLQVLRQSGVSAEDFIQRVDLDDPWFRKRKLRIVPRSAYERDGVESIDVRVSYQGDRTNRIFDAGTGPQEVEWQSVVRDGAVVRDIEYDYTIRFSSVDGLERPVSLESPKCASSVDTIEIQPRELFGVTQIPIVGDGFPWDRYPKVRVECRYSDPAHGIAMEDSFVLDAKATDKLWKVFQLDPKQDVFEHALTYFAADHRDVSTGWVPIRGEQIVLRDPRPARWRLQVVPVANWTEVDRMFVDLSYEEPGRDRQEKSLEFTKDHKTPETFAISTGSDERSPVKYRVSVLMTSGDFTEIPESMTRESRIFVRPDMKGHRIVTIRTPRVRFEDLRLARVRVECEYRDDDATISFREEVRFDSSEQARSFEYDYVDVGKSSYRHRVTLEFDNGLSRSKEWEDSDADELVVDID